ncbi:hypothetical protein [Halalkalibacter oceani]|uniref:Uncharacterized protein n=1 Tax=Halalkalibacter oceani TaxID=1653776 RepID=A0A9X2DSB8_9BACI|nr:hypothetical protein [Halalkalibacter oceani]MCM3716216.1 hypothetical protein [Halalkalibacter oceani]
MAGFNLQSYTMIQGGEAGDKMNALTLEGENHFIKEVVRWKAGEGV